MLLNCGIGEDSWESLGLQEGSNHSILKEISPGISLEGMLKLKLQYFGHLMRRVDSLEKTLILGGIGAGGEGDDRGWDGWMASLTWWTWVWVNAGSWWWTGRPGVLWFMGLQRVGHDWATELNWTELRLQMEASHMATTWWIDKVCLSTQWLLSIKPNGWIHMDTCSYPDLLSERSQREKATGCESTGCESTGCESTCVKRL